MYSLSYSKNSTKSTSQPQRAKSLVPQNYVEATRSTANTKDKHYAWFDGFSYLSCRETEFSARVNVKLQPGH